jgi:cysteine synthase A
MIAAAALRGVAIVPGRHHPGVRIVAVAPAESPALSGGAAGPYRIGAVGIGCTPRQLPLSGTSQAGYHDR